MDAKQLAASLAEVMSECPMEVALRRMEARIERALADEREACALAFETSVRSSAECYDETTAATLVIVAGIAADAIRARGAK